MRLKTELNGRYEFILSFIDPTPIFIVHWYFRAQQNTHLDLSSDILGHPQIHFSVRFELRRRTIELLEPPAMIEGKRERVSA